MKGTEVNMRIQCSWGRVAQVTVLLAIALFCAACNRSPQARSAKFMTEGKRLLEKKEPARAILQFRNAAQATPRDPEVYYQLGLAYLAAGDLRQGVITLRKALDLNPKHAGAQLRLARLMVEAGDPDLLKDAQQRLNGLLQDSPDDPNALQALALTELKLGEPEDALQHLARAEAAAPGQVVIAVNMAQAKLQQRDTKGAEAILKKAVESSPNSVDAHLVFADFYVSQKKNSEAEAQFKRALEIDPKNGPALMALARFQLTQGRKQDAEQSFKRVSGFAGYETVYGLFLSEEGRSDESLLEFEKLAKAHPGDRQIRTRLVAAYQNANRLDDAKKILGAVLKKNPNDLDALLQRGELLMGSGEYPQAEADLNKVLKLKPDSPEIHYVIAKLNQARGNMLIYRQELSQALRLNPFLLPVRLESARDLIASNSGTAALDLLDQTPESQRGSASVLVVRNWALWSVGDMAQMRKGIDRGLALGKSADFLVQDGFWKLRAGHAEAARASLEAALALNPADLGALTQLSHAYGKNTPIALQKIKEYASRQPQSAEIQDFLGLMLMVHGDRVGARKAFETAKADAPRSVPTNLFLVQLDVVDGKIDDARKGLHDVLASSPGNATATLWLGILDEKKGDHVAAIEHLRKAVEANPGDAQALNNLSYELIEHGNQPDEALKYAQKAVELSPENPAYSDTLGWILYSKGLYVPAVRYLEKAAAKPGTVVWKYHLAMAYAKAGDTNRSHTTLDAALKLNRNVPEAKIAQELIGNSR
jgi:tetratricopeptide (TPR) repeat protein